jgi:hypothetical protein
VKNCLCLVVCSIALVGCAGSRNSTNLLVMGNSITLHAPEPYLDWYGDWGMAAASKQTDFSHITASALQLPLTIQGLNIERDPQGSLQQINSLVNQVDASTVVILEFGDNVPSDGVAAFGSAYEQLTSVLRNANALVCVSTWWVKPDVDQVISAACQAHHGQYVFIGDLYTDPANTDFQTTQFLNPEVNAHPHQWGHAHIAGRILSKFGK